MFVIHNHTRVREHNYNNRIIVGFLFFFFIYISIIYIQVCQERGWKEYEGTKSGDSAWSVPADEYWNLWWKSTGFSLSHYKQQKIWQVCEEILCASILCIPCVQCVQCVIYYYAYTVCV